MRFIYLCIQYMMTDLQPAGFPHSEIHGSMLVCSSPWLIAAYHVLHRPSMPRHPPYALTYLSPAIVHGLDSCRFDALMSRYFVYNGYCFVPASRSSQTCHSNFTFAYKRHFPEDKSSLSCRLLRYGTIITSMNGIWPTYRQHRLS